MQQNDTITAITAMSDREFVAEMTRYTPNLRAFARSLCGCRERADDLAQEALTKAWAARDRYNAGTNFKAWLFTILRNHFYSEARRARFVGEYDQDHAERTLVTNGSQEDTMALIEVMRGLETLPHTHRDALILSAVGDMSYEEIAEVCGIALGTVKSRVCRARAMLVATLDGGKLPDARHDFVLEGDATALMMHELGRAAAANGAIDRVAA